MRGWKQVLETGSPENRHTENRHTVDGGEAEFDQRSEEIGRLSSELRAIEARLSELHQTTDPYARSVAMMGINLSHAARETRNPTAVAADQLMQRYLRTR